MKKLLFILPLLIACKSTKNANCDAYGAYRIPYTDSIVVSEYHVFPVLDNKHQCVYFPKEIIYIKDNTEFHIPIHYEYQKIIK